MTSPIGTPDDQTYTNAAGGPLITGIYSAPAGTSTAFQQPVGSYNGLLVNAQPSVSGIVILFQFYADAAYSQFTGQWAAKVGGSAITQLIGPVLGNYVKCTVTNPTGSAVNVPFDATPVNVAAPALSYLTDQNYVNRGVTSVPISTTQNYPLPYVQPGPAWLWFQPQDATGKLNIIVAVDANFPSVGGPIFRQDGPTAAVTEYLGLQDLPIVVMVTNTDATSAHSFRLALNPVGST